MNKNYIMALTLIKRDLIKKIKKLEAKRKDPDDFEIIINGDKYNSYFEKILDVLTLSPDSLYSVRVTAPMVSAVYSSNAPADYIPSEKEKKQCDLLENLLALASTYCSY